MEAKLFTSNMYVKWEEMQRSIKYTDLAPPDHLREGERPGLGGLGTRPDQGQRPGGDGRVGKYTHLETYNSSNRETW